MCSFLSLIFEFFENIFPYLIEICIWCGSILLFLAAIFPLLEKTIFPLLKETSFYKRISNWLKKRHSNNRLYSSEDINEKVSKFDFNNIGKSKQLDGKNIGRSYKEDMRVMTIVDHEGMQRDIHIPYLEIINFNKNRNVDISISCSNADPLFLNEQFELPDNIERATKASLNNVLKNNPNTTDDKHPRLASLEKKGNNQYKCVLQETHYYSQIRTNLSMDSSIYIEQQNQHRSTTIRRLEQEQHDEELKVWMKNGIAFDALHPRCLTSLDKSILANVIGVSAIWCMEDEAEGLKFYMMPRNKKVGVYKNSLGIPSGDIESPIKQENRFRDKSLIEYLKWEIAREFAEETGIADNDKNLEDYSNTDVRVNGRKIPLKKKIKRFEKMEIIPLAFTREILRGGKPQMFFLIKTKRISDRDLKKAFKKSVGGAEFKNGKFTTASISAEVACNYLYAQEYLQRNQNGIIYLN